MNGGRCLKKLFETQFVQKWFLVFLIYAVIGWIYEVVLETFIYKWGFSNRGVLFGPYCPIYGTGALVFLFFYNKCLKGKNISKNKWINGLVKIILTFLLCMVVATIIELAASYILEFFTGKWLWMTYVNYKYNFQGRIALSTSLRFGLGGLVFIFLIQPLLDKLCLKLKGKALDIISIVLAIIVIIDAIYTFVF
jgi:uncharacterized membrane protein